MRPESGGFPRPSRASETMLRGTSLCTQLSPSNPLHCLLALPPHSPYPKSPLHRWTFLYPSFGPRLHVWGLTPTNSASFRGACQFLILKGRPRGMGWRGRWVGGLGWGTHVNPWLIHVNVWQKPLQYCKVISLQRVKINGKK